MKKVLLIGMALCIMVAAQAQDKTPVKKVYTKSNRSLIQPGDMLLPGPYNPSNYTVKQGTKGFEKFPCGSSVNAYGMLYTDGPLSANAALNTVMLTHRKGGPFGGVGDQVQMKFTTDFGVTWDSVVVATSYAMRYPVGTIYNPAGNTTVANAYGIASGPEHLSGDWNFSYIATAPLTNLSTPVIHEEPMPYTGIFAPYYNGLSASNGHAHVEADASPEAGFTGDSYFGIENAVFNTGTSTFDWAPELQVTNQWKQRTFSNDTVPYTFNTSMAFEEDGIHGYLFTYGRDLVDDPHNAQQPYIWITSDAGVTWVKQPAWDFGTDAVLRQYLFPTAATWDQTHIDNNTFVIRPIFPAGATTEEGRFPGVVDAEGNLHLMCQIEGGYSENPDSLDYVYTNHPIYIFIATYRKDVNQWCTTFVTQLQEPVTDAANGGYGDVGWDHEFNLMTNNDRTKLFCVWTDTDSLLGQPCNLTPDVWGWGYNLTNDSHIAPHNFTVGTIYEADNLFLHAARDVLNTTSNEYALPVATTTLGATPDNPVVYSYFDGIYFTDADFTLTDTISSCLITSATAHTAMTSFSVSQNYPNPFDGSTQIDVTMPKANTLSLEVVNLMGQTVYSVDKGYVMSGPHTLTIDAANLTSGVYFYKVKVGDQTKTSKMVVK